MSKLWSYVSTCFLSFSSTLRLLFACSVCFALIYLVCCEIHVHAVASCGHDHENGRQTQVLTSVTAVVSPSITHASLDDVVSVEPTLQSALVRV